MADARDIFAKTLGVVHVGKAHVERQFQPLGLTNHINKVLLGFDAT